VERSLEVRHLRVYLQQVQIGKGLAAVLTGVTETRLLMHRFDMLPQSAPAAQPLATLRTRGLPRSIMRALVTPERLAILEGFATCLE